MTGEYAECLFKCSNDYECPRFHYCCSNGCGRLCVPLQPDVVDNCGCSVTFVARDASVGVRHLVWESLSNSLTPSLEPFIVASGYQSFYIGPMENSCSFKKAIEFGTSINEYSGFKKPRRILILIADGAGSLKEMADVPFNVMYNTICAITVGYNGIDESLKKQLSVIENNQPCLWSVDSLVNLGDVAPSISSIVNDGSCLCGADVNTNSPCKAEGETCTKDSECNHPTHICNKGTCTLVSCSQPEKFDPEPSSFYSYNYNYRNTHYNDFGIESDYFYKTIFGFYDDYDYFFREDLAFRTRFSEGSIKKGNHESKLSLIKTMDAQKILGNQGHGQDNAKTKTAAPKLVSLLVQTVLGCCAWDEFQCSGVPAICIKDYSVCDGIQDCFNGEDETPEACAKRVCDDRWFKCNSGQCMDKKFRCDGIKNCPDGSDENCFSQSDCPSARPHFCSSGECINFRDVCDQTIDCRSGEDELHCRCKGYRCPSGECISNDRVCDGYPHCRDASDEYCKGSNGTCLKDRSIKCDDGKCIAETAVCDRVYECSDNSDEALSLCFPERCFYCNSGQCIHKDDVCDVVIHCDDRSDEINCKDLVCGQNRFQCKSGECLLESVVCNGREECADGSDELICDTCPDSKPLRCSSGECIDYTMVCNRVYDCTDRSDESKCLKMACPSQRPGKCNSGECVYDAQYCPDDVSDSVLQCGEFKCKSGGCVYRCDGRRECDDGADEEDCEGVPCPDQYNWRCKSGECLKNTSRCNGHKECTDGSDEKDCLDFKCASYDFECTSGECISSFLECDGKKSCKDGSDEKDCRKKPACDRTKKKCDTGVCIYNFAFCDGSPQCFDGSDENNCQNITCPDDRPFHCKSGVCRKASQRCDGFISCEDGSDEENCQNYTCPAYRPYSCPSGICISLYQLCNGVDDCGDGSDEMDCENVKCPEKAFKCNKGNCILPKYRCDGVGDCDDGEDELNCGTSRKQWG